MLQAIFTDGVDEITVHGLTQWDKGQELEISLSSLPETFQVHFSWKGYHEAYVVEATSDGWEAVVPIPNILLQKCRTGVAWVYLTGDGTGKTVKTINLPITSRAKPSDYAYTEIEILDIATVINKAQAIADTATAAALEAKEAEAAATQAAAEAKAVQENIPADYTALAETVNGHTEEIGQLFEDIAAIVDAEKTEIVLGKADMITPYDNTFGTNGYISEYGTFTANNSYRTYYCQVTSDVDIYARAYGGGIAIFDGSISQNTFAARYKSGTETFPTNENRLHVTAGQWLAIYYSYSGTEDRDITLYTGLYTAGEVKPTAQFVKAVGEGLGIDKRVVSKTASSIRIIMGKATYEVNRYDNNTTRAHVWRTNACYLDNDGEQETVWVDSDSDGVVKIKNEADFIGGYHGDETQTLFKLYVDGVEYAEDAVFDNLPFDEIVLFAESDVYHCNTSATPDVVAFKRSKILRFNVDGYTVENCWTAQEDVTLEIAYIGMLSVEKDIIKAYSANADYKMHDAESSASRSHDMTEVCFVVDGGSIGIKVENPLPNDTYSCGVSAYDERLKVYATTIINSSQGALSAGDVIRGKATTFVK